MYAFRALNIYEKLGNKPLEAFALNNVAVIYQDIQEYGKAILFHKKALSIRRSIGASKDMAYSFANLANNFIKLKLYKEAFNYNDSAIQILQETSDNIAFSAVLNNQGNILIKMGKWRESLNPLEKGLNIRRTLNDRKGIASSLTNLASVHMHFKEFPLAENEMKEALQLSLLIGAKPERAQLYTNFADLYESMGKFEKAYTFSRLYTALNDTLLNESKTRQINELEAKYANKQKEQENKILALKVEEEKANTFIILGSGILVLLILGFIILRQKNKQKTREIELSLELEKKRTLAIIETQDKERERISGELHDGVGQTLAIARLKAAQIEHEEIASILPLLDSSVKEIRSISHNLMPGILLRGGLEAAILELSSQINESGQMNVFCDFDLKNKRLSSEFEINIYRIIQELSHNTIKYAKATEFHISLNSDEKMIVLMVEDNGIGFDKEILKTKPGNGWSNILSRTKLMQGHIELDTQMGRGTSIVIEIPCS